MSYDIDIKIKSKHLEDIIFFYSEKQKGCLIKISDLEKEVKEISGIIIQLKKAFKDSQDILVIDKDEHKLYDGYVDKWPWIKKIIFAIEKSRKALTTKEIVDFLIDYEPELIHDRKRAVGSVSSILSVKSAPPGGDKKEFTKFDSDTGEFAYAVWQETLDYWEKIQKTASETLSTDYDLPF